MQLKTQEHIDLMAYFECQNKSRRLDREAKDLWPMGRLYQDGAVNDAFLEFRKGYALAKSIYQNA